MPHWARPNLVKCLTLVSEIGLSYHDIHASQLPQATLSPHASSPLESLRRLGCVRVINSAPGGPRPQKEHMESRKMALLLNCVQSRGYTRPIIEYLERALVKKIILQEHGYKITLLVLLELVFRTLNSL